MSGFLLVHGSWHGAWVWDGVIPFLVAGGYRVEAPDLAGRGDDPRPPANILLADHVERVTDALSRFDRPPVVVGHSFGGFVISHVAEQMPERVALLVYVAAFLLGNGETVLGVAGSMPSSIAHLEIREDVGLVSVRPAAARRAFYGDCSAEDADRAIARLVPEALAPRRTPARISPERFGRVPRAYVETVEDQALPVAGQRRMHAALPCRDVVTLTSGHSPFISMPGTLAEELVRLGDPFLGRAVGR